MGSTAIEPLPQGFQLEPPEGFVLEQNASALPEGFQLEKAQEPAKPSIIDRAKSALKSVAELAQPPVPILKAPEPVQQNYPGVFEDAKSMFQETPISKIQAMDLREMQIQQQIEGLKPGITEGGKLTAPFVELPEREARFPDSKISQAAASVFNRIMKPGIEFAESPIGVATAGSAAVGVPAKVIAAAFTVEAMRAAPEIGTELGNALSDPSATFQQKADAVSGAIALTGMALPLGFELVKAKRAVFDPALPETIGKALTASGVDSSSASSISEALADPKKREAIDANLQEAGLPQNSVSVMDRAVQDMQQKGGEQNAIQTSADQGVLRPGEQEAGIQESQGNVRLQENGATQQVTERPLEALGPANVGPQLSPAGSPVANVQPKSQQQIITDLARGLKLPIRFGRLMSPKAGGYFLRRPDLIGSKFANDTPIVAHEVGHKLDAMFDLSKNPKIRGELDNLGDPNLPGSRSSWTKSRSKAYKLGEGIAEFTRHWMTDDAAAKSLAPNTYAHFESILDANKDVGDVLRTAKSDINVWRNAEAQARLRSHISVGDNPNKTPYTLSQLTRDTVDDLHFLKLFMDDASRKSGTAISPSKDVYMLARNLRGSFGMAESFINKGVVDFNTREVKIGTSLEHALKDVAGRIQDFRDWIVAKQAQELHRQGKETGLVKSDVDTTAKRFDADPAFQAAFSKLRMWNDAVLKYSVDSGALTQKSADAMRKMNLDYVPFHRLFEVGAGEPAALESSGSGRGLNAGKPGSYRSRTGSTRPIVDPIETLVKNAYTVITAAEKSHINQMVADFANSPGMGKWVERVATPKEQIKVSLEKLEKQLEALGADLTTIPPAPPDAPHMLEFFRQSNKAPFGENIIKVNRNGKAEFYRLDKDLFNTFHALDLEDSGTLMRIFSSPAQLLRAGVTLTPDFAVSNIIRDNFGAAVISKYGGLPFERAVRGMAAMIGNKKLVAEWAASGGKQSVEANYFDRAKLQKYITEKITKDLTIGERAMIAVRSPLTLMRFLTGTFEEATRIGEYQKALNKLVKSGMPIGEARRMAAFEARDLQDFAKGGAKTKILRHSVPFWNASLQGNVRLVQAFKNHPVRTTLAGLAFVTLPKMIEQGLNWNDDDYWDRPQWERDLFYMIPTGKSADGHTRFLRVPVPFEVGIIFATVPGRMMQWLKGNDPHSFDGLANTIIQQTVPKPIPPPLTVMFENFLTGKQGWDMYRDRPVVPDSLADLPPEMQFTEQTSLTAKTIGKNIGFSPMKIDHIISGVTGGVGQQTVSQIFDRALEAAGAGERTAKNKVPGGRFVSVPLTITSEPVNRFYETLSQLKMERQREKQGEPSKLDTGWVKLFEHNSLIMSKLRKEMLATKDETVRTALRQTIFTIAKDTMTEYNKATQSGVQR